MHRLAYNSKRVHKPFDTNHGAVLLLGLLLYALFVSKIKNTAKNELYQYINGVTENEMI